MAEKTYYCSYCGKVETGENAPNQVGCTKGSSHYWQYAGEVGNQTYECSYCNLTLKLNSSPRQTNGCPKGSSHYWKKK